MTSRSHPIISSNAMGSVPPAGPMTAMLDTNVFDALLDDPPTLIELVHATADNRLLILVTHVQVDEIVDTAASSIERTKRLLHVLLRCGAREIETHGFVLGRSRLGLAELTGTEALTSIDAYTGGNEAHLEDALIAATAQHRGALLVTNERRRGRFTRAFPRLRVTDLDGLCRAITPLAVADVNAANR